MRGLIGKAIRKIRSGGVKEFYYSSYNKLKNVFLRYRCEYYPTNSFNVRGITVDTRDVQISTEMYNSLARGKYESAEADLIKKHLQSDDSVIDLGGCLGFSACYASEILDDDMSHVIVEPNTYLTSTIKRNRDINSCNFNIVHAAYSNRELITLNISENVYGSASNAEKFESSNEIVDTITVGGIDIEGLKSQFDISTFQLISDIEGGEIGLIVNEIDTLERSCSLIIMEFHPDVEPVSKVESILDDSSFELVDGSVNNVAVYKNCKI